MVFAHGSDLCRAKHERVYEMRPASVSFESIKLTIFTVFTQLCTVWISFGWTEAGSHFLPNRQLTRHYNGFTLHMNAYRQIIFNLHTTKTHTKQQRKKTANHLSHLVLKYPIGKWFDLL